MLERRGEVCLMVLWQDWSLDTGVNATDVLSQLCGGWNPEKLPELRRTLDLVF